MKKKEQHWDQMYQMPLDNIPWEIKKPPEELRSFLGRHKLRPLDEVLDVACGTGNYSIYLASLGYRVTGIDFSKEALRIARKNAKAAGVSVRFIYRDALNLNGLLKKKFDFILDYSLLHHIPFYQTGRYAKQFSRLLKPKGKLLLICYSKNDPDAKGKRTIIGKYGNTMYYRTAKEIRAAHKGLTEYEYTEARLGKRLQHLAYCFIFEKT